MIQERHSVHAPSSRLITLCVIAGVALVVISVWLLTEPIAQPLLYHNFADQRPMLGMPHALNVLSNVLFFLSGILGCALIARRTARLSLIDAIYLVFFVGVFFTGIGSAYYHWSPDNTTLVWDRLPMTVGFMAFTALVVSERYDKSFGYTLFPWLLTVGVLSVVYWGWQDDLRPYLAVQFGPMLMLPLIIWRFSGPGTSWLWLTIAFYALAKLVEVFDHQIFEISERVISGHTLKHLIAAMGTVMVVAKVGLADPDT